MIGVGRSPRPGWGEVRVEDLQAATAVPNGAWPDPIAGSFSDGTVTDGTATWSVS